MNKADVREVVLCGIKAHNMKHLLRIAILSLAQHRQKKNDVEKDIYVLHYGLNSSSKIKVAHGNLYEIR
jgi:hypothetical protein